MSNKQTFEIYVVTAYKFGEIENHSYVVGTFTDKNKAIKCADDHTEYRGEKYACHVDVCINNYYNEDDEEHTETIYKTKSYLCKEEDF